MTFFLSKLRPLWILTIALALSACAAPKPLSQVTLLPDAQGKTTSVLVTTAKGSQVLNAPYQVAQVDRKLAINATATNADAVNKAHPALIQGLVGQSQSFVLFFQPGTSTLTGESLAALPSVIAAARQRPGGEIIITGHTDRQLHGIMAHLQPGDRGALEGFAQHLPQTQAHGRRSSVGLASKITFTCRLEAKRRRFSSLAVGWSRNFTSYTR